MYLCSRLYSDSISALYIFPVLKPIGSSIGCLSKGLLFVIHDSFQVPSDSKIPIVKTNHTLFQHNFIAFMFSYSFSDYSLSTYRIYLTIFSTLESYPVFTGYYFFFYCFSNTVTTNMDFVC